MVPPIFPQYGQCRGEEEDLQECRRSEIDQGIQPRQHEENRHQHADGHELKSIENRVAQLMRHDRAGNKCAEEVMQPSAIPSFFETKESNRM